MARARDQFRSSDVTFWGLVALVCGAIAVLSANVSALIPDGIFAGLHTSRLEGATLGQLRARVATLEAEQSRLERETATLNSRFALAEQQDGTVARRVGALEVSVPQVLEAARAGGVDVNEVTASIGSTGTVTSEAEGGSVAVRQQALADSELRVPTQPLPPIPAAQTVAAIEPNAIGIALGPSVTDEGAEAAWQSMQARIGTLLLGLEPALGEAEGSSEKRLLAGPLEKAAAGELCRHVTRVGIDCLVVPYSGQPLPR